MLRWLLELIRGAGRRTGRVLPKRERVKLIFRRLREAEPAADAEQALTLIHRVVDEVEDEHSGQPKEERPPLRSGRMYGPFDDRIERHRDGSITAETFRDVIRIGRDGSIRIETLTGQLRLEKPGKDTRSDDNRATAASDDN